MKNKDVYVAVQDQFTKSGIWHEILIYLTDPYIVLIQDFNKITISYQIPLFCYKTAFKLPHLYLYFSSTEHVFLLEYECWLNFKLIFGAFLQTPYTPVYGTLFCSDN